MDATIVDSLFALGAAVCMMLLLYGGWLCLRYGRAMPPFRGGRKADAAAARAAACAPAQDDREVLAKEERTGGFASR